MKMCGKSEPEIGKAHMIHLNSVKCLQLEILSLLTPSNVL